ncbi:hypothetical protein [Moraxella oblonga]|uniref:hypothetical protein n=1 Tax=Moraxella oblonga TaxID=200413 RepID=UPI00082F8554|nr:hypothetical protein [Moraxella oblonga]
MKLNKPLLGTLIIFVVYAIMSLSFLYFDGGFDIHEGVWAVATELNQIFLFFVLIGGIGIYAIYQLSPKNYDNWWDFITNLIVVLFIPYIFITSLDKVVDKWYYTLFEHKKVVVTDNYTLQKYEYRGNYSYYLSFNENQTVRINKSTYQKLKVNTVYELTITYQPKAEILYEIQMVEK